MNRNTWTAYICLSMITIGTHLLIHSRNVPEIIQFLGGYAVTSGVVIIAVECFTRVFVNKKK